MNSTEKEIFTKKIPFSLREKIESMTSNKSEVKISFPNLNNPFPLTLTDKQTPEFHFSIVKFHLRNGERTPDPEITLNLAPASQHNISSINAGCVLSLLHEVYNYWRSLVDKHNSLSPLFDDPILNQYYEELNFVFEIIDEDADTTAFNRMQQKIIENFYSELIEVVKTDKEIDAKEKQLLVQEFSDARQIISRSTKKQVVDTLRKGMAKLWKYASGIFDKTIVRFGSDFLKGVIKGEIDPTTFLP